MIDVNKYEVYTDGAYSSKRNLGGIGILVFKDNVLYDAKEGKYKDTTNNRMELTAVIIALSILREDSHDTFFEVKINSDSQYVIGCASLGWSRKKNSDLWDMFDRLNENCKITFNWIKGHDKNKYNNICDYFAQRNTL